MIQRIIGDGVEVIEIKRTCSTSIFNQRKILFYFFTFFFKKFIYLFFIVISSNE